MYVPERGRLFVPANRCRLAAATSSALASVITAVAGTIDMQPARAFSLHGSNDPGTTGVFEQ